MARGTVFREDRNYRIDGGEEEGKVFNLRSLPEDCLAKALSLTTPVDACRLAVVSPTFSSASHSDLVWERFLPLDYKEIISRSIDGQELLNSFANRRAKDVYLYLCDHSINIDGGIKSFWLDKWTGKKCIMLSARNLTIIWGDTPNYWQWISDPESRFSEVAKLVDVCWLEIRGEMSTSILSPYTTYAAYLVFKMSPGTYGFEREPAKAWVTFGGDMDCTTMETRDIYVDPEAATRYRTQIAQRRNRLMPRHYVPPPMSGDVEYPKRRADGWQEVLLGEFYVSDDPDWKVRINFMETKGGNWKRGLIVEGTEIRPKGHSDG